MTAPVTFDGWNGALLVRKEAGMTSFGVIERLQRGLRERYGVPKKSLPKLGHGGTLDPFATGLLPICTGDGVKLARYFLGSEKEYTGLIRFGQTTVPGDPTDPVSETSENIPATIEDIRSAAHQFTGAEYLQTPPMHSAKKIDGKPLYELARAGVEIHREPSSCRVYSFEITEYIAPVARFRVAVSSGTYIRVLAQDLGRRLGTVAMLDSLERTRTGDLRLEHALPLSDLSGDWPALAAWVPFDRLLDGYASADADDAQALALIQGKQQVLPLILRQVRPATRTTPDDCIAVYHRRRLRAVLRRDPASASWGLERVFPEKMS